MRGIAFFRGLPRWARRLWYAILAVTALEVAFFVLTLFWAPGWIWLSSEIFSLSAWPLGLGVVVVVVVGSVSSRWRGALPRPAREEPSRPRGEAGYEIDAARGAARLLAEAARRPQGQAAIRRTARLARAVRAASRPAGEQGDPPSR